MAWSIHTTSPIGAPKSEASLAGTNFITSKGAWDAILTAEEQMTSLLPRLRCNPNEAAFISNLVKIFCNYLMITINRSIIHVKHFEI
jgi:hypothetical protein